MFFIIGRNNMQNLKNYNNIFTISLQIAILIFATNLTIILWICSFTYCQWFTSIFCNFNKLFFKIETYK
jgi:hypothetical protein